MKNENDKALDDLFKRSLADPVDEAGFREADWDALEEMMDKPQKRRGIIFWLPILSAAAALLLFFGWLFFKQPVIVDSQQALTKNNTKVEQQHQQQATVVKHDASKSQIDSVKPAGKTQQEPEKNLANNTATKENILPNKGGAAKKQSPGNFIANNSAKNAFKTKGVDNAGTRPDAKQLANNELVYPMPVNYAASLTAVRHDILENDLGNSANNKRVVSKDIVGNRVYKPALPKDDDNSGTTKLGFAKHPQLTLSFIGAPELNTVSSVGGATAGTNFGLLFSAGIFNKLTVTSGATYSTKPYETDISNYHTTYNFKTSPSDIEADCRLLDIPINLDYQLYNKHNNKFSIGSGLSSYIMLHESYDYYYANPGTAGPTSYTVKSDGKYFFGIVNLQATYTRQVNSKFGLSVQPYMKLPISNIGYSQARLQTSGVAIGVNWNLNSLTKP